MCGDSFIGTPVVCEFCGTPVITVPSQQKISNVPNQDNNINTLTEPVDDPVWSLNNLYEFILVASDNPLQLIKVPSESFSPEIKTCLKCGNSFTGTPVVCEFCGTPAITIPSQQKTTSATSQDSNINTLTEPVADPVWSLNNLFDFILVASDNPLQLINVPFESFSPEIKTCSKCGNSFTGTPVVCEFCGTPAITIPSQQKTTNDTSQDSNINTLTEPVDDPVWSINNLYEFILVASDNPLQLIKVPSESFSPEIKTCSKCGNSCTGTPVVCEFCGMPVITVPSQQKISNVPNQDININTLTEPVDDPISSLNNLYDFILVASDNPLKLIKVPSESFSPEIKTCLKCGNSFTGTPVVCEFCGTPVLTVPSQQKTTNDTSQDSNINTLTEPVRWCKHGWFLNNIGRYSEAVDSYDKAISLKPDYADAWYNRGNALSNLGQHTEATTSYDKAIAINPDFNGAWINRGCAFDALRRYEEAVNSYDRAIAIDPYDFRALSNRGVALLELRRYEEAADSFDKAIVINPNSAIVWYFCGVALNYLRQHEKAVDSYDKAVAIKSDYAEAWNNRGATLRQLGQYSESIASFDKAVAIKPDYAEAWHNREIALKDLRSHEEMFVSQDKAVVIDLKYDYAMNSPKHVLEKQSQPNPTVTAYDTDALQHYNKGVDFAKRGQYLEAIASYDKVVVINPNHVKAWYNRGVVLNNLGRYAEAVASYNKVIAIKPDFAEAWYNCGTTLRHLGRYAEAVDSYDKAVAIKPDYAEAWNNRGVVLNDLGRYTEAVDSYDKAITIKSDYAEAWNNRGVALDELGRYAEAIGSYNIAVAIKPDYPEAWNNREIILKKLN